MIKILAACGAGVNSSHQIKSALEEELSNRGYDVHCDAVMVKDVNEDLMKGYDIFTPIAATDLGFEPGIPVIEAGKNAWSICLCVYFYITNYKQNKNIKKETKKNRK
ncbi:PTS system galactose-specific transporter subunit IIB [Streptococcus pneumoniae]|nr:PTS system galactose-specific transporter subunit IIB [Streptococcus pneumoniae]